MAKELETRGLERNGLADLWRREWKATVILSLKGAHADWLSIHDQISKRLKGLPDDHEPLSQEWAATVQAGERAAKTLAMLHEQMMQMNLHPTRPKGEQPSRGGGRPRKAGDTAEPVEAVEVPMPRPEVDVPRGTKETP